MVPLTCLKVALSIGLENLVLLHKPYLQQARLYFKWPPHDCVPTGQKWKPHRFLRPRLWTYNTSLLPILLIKRRHEVSLESRNEETVSTITVRNSQITLQRSMHRIILQTSHIVLCPFSLVGTTFIVLKLPIIFLLIIRLYTLFQNIYNYIFLYILGNSNDQFSQENMFIIYNIYVFIFPPYSFQRDQIYFKYTYQIPICSNIVFF